MALRPQDDIAPVAALFYAGRYQDVLAATVEAHGEVAPEALPFAVGALAFAGRLTEAELLAPRVLRACGAPGVAACAFSLAVALARAGRVPDAIAALRRALAVTAGRRDGPARAWLLQGAACVRYFTGQLRRAAVVAERALAGALRGGFPYLAMLANDLRGHALAQAGEVARGTRVLGHAQALAQRLGYVANAHTIELAVTLYRARHAPAAEATALLTAALARDATQDSFSRRSIGLELATVRAWTGRATEAASALAEVAAQCRGEPRLEALLALAEVHVVRVRQGCAAARAALDRLGSALTDAADPAVRIEVAALRLACARALGEPLGPAADALRALHCATGIDRARAWQVAYGAEADAPDGLPPMLAAIARATPPAVLDAGLLGLLPECARLTPARRVHLFADALVVERDGDLDRLPSLAPRGRSLLVALAAGVGERAALVGAVWGLRAYAPERHDGVVKTALSRLRAALGHGGRWIVADDAGYHVAPGVQVIDHAPGAERPAPLPAARAAPSDRAERARWRRILDAVERSGNATVGALSRRLGVPTRTLSRELTALCAGGLLTREGAGRSTTYRIP